MDFDTFTVVLLTRPPDAPVLSEAEANAMQDRHLAHIAGLADTGALVAAGPVGDERYRGVSILTVPPEEALALKAVDPAVQAGLYELTALRWQVPAGAVRFERTRFPRSVAEALA
jgi:uncharacterized protein